MGTFRQESRQSELLLSFRSEEGRVRLKDVLDGLKKRGLEFGQGLGGAVVLIDGKNAWLMGGLEAEVVDGATVVIMSFAGGG